MALRTEHDSLGSLDLDDVKLYGIHTARALANFGGNGPLVPEEILRAMVEVKKAAVLANRDGGFMEPKKAGAVLAACEKILSDGISAWREHFPLPAHQGGAGTSVNMNVNEVIANLAIAELGGRRGDYSLVHPNDDVNRFQSTNDVFPTAVRIACVRAMLSLADSLARLQEAFQTKEHEFAAILKVGRTEMQDAIPVTLGQEFGAWAEAVARDRWRCFKCEERLRQVNIGGTAVGTGVNAPKLYIFKVIEHLRSVTGLGLARAENMVEATQNADVFVECSGILKACASNFVKISHDLRLLSSGPSAGFGEIVLPPVQAGSSIMPGKVNPVIPEFAAAAGIQVMGLDASTGFAASQGQLELNAFLPLIAWNFLESARLLREAADALAAKCVAGIAADAGRCAELLSDSGALATLLSPYVGYEKAAEIILRARENGKSVLEEAIAGGEFTRAELEAVFDPRKATSPGIAGADTLKGRLDLLGK